MQKAEVTAFLSLIFILMLSLVGGIMESASIQVTKNRRRADMNRALESVFAEYQIDLLEKYDIFALEGSYESGTYEEQKIVDRLAWFGAGHMDHQIQKIQFLTDHNGKAFYEQIIYYMENKYGLDHLKKKASMTDLWKSQDEQIKDCVRNEEESKGALDDVLRESESSLPEKDNPIASADQLKCQGVLDLIVPKDMQISDKRIFLSESLSRRKKNQGYGDFSKEDKESGKLSALMFGEYLQEHFSAATDEKKTGMLEYELEYIYAGKESDRDNLKAVAEKLLMFRYVPNYMYLQGSVEKKAEAEAVALTLCAAVAVPGITEVVKQAILLAWAFAESVADLRMLLKGSKVPLAKSDGSWQLSLTSLMEWKQNGQLDGGKDLKEGLNYREYLRILLFLQKKEKATMRSLDLIEWNLRKIHGKDFFRGDFCISKMKLKSRISLRRGINYQFETYYGYQ